jgi:hypothetical protein
MLNHDQIDDRTTKYLPLSTKVEDLVEDLDQDRHPENADPDSDPDPNMYSFQLIVKIK